MDLDEIKANKKRGDIGTVAEILDLKPQNVAAALERQNSKHHRSVVNTLEVIINTRYILINQRELLKRESF